MVVGIKEGPCALHKLESMTAISTRNGGGVSGTLHLYVYICWDVAMQDPLYQDDNSTGTIRMDIKCLVS